MALVPKLTRAHLLTTRKTENVKATNPQFTAVKIAGGSIDVVLDHDDLVELIGLEILPRWWWINNRIVQVPLPGGAPISVARLITEADSGYRVRYRDGNPRNLRRSNLTLRPFKQAKQDGAEAKALCRRLAELNRKMQVRGRREVAA
jgi:hypothetical protein